MILALHSSDRGSNASLSFFCSCFLFAFYCFWSCSFFFLSWTESIAQHLPHLSIKSQRTVDLLLYCIAKFNLFLWIHSSCLHTKAIQTPRPQLLCSKLNVFTIGMICFSNCVKMLYLALTRTNCWNVHMHMLMQNNFKVFTLFANNS